MAVILEIINGRPRLPRLFKGISWRFNSILYFFGGLENALQESSWVRERFREFFELVAVLTNPECDPGRDIILIKEVAAELLDEFQSK